MKKTAARFFNVFIFMSIFPHIISAQTDSVLKANTLIRIEQALCDALPGDTATWSKYLDPAWHAVTEDGSETNRKDFLLGFSPFSKGVSGHISVIRPLCLFHGDVAVVHYVADEYETVYGQQLHTTYAAADTWYQTGNRWQMISMQIFEIPQLPPAVKPVLADIQKLTGIYELTENKTAEVRWRNDSLLLIKGNHPPELMYEETGNVFFTKTNTRGRILFVRADSGKMKMIERRNGQDLVWTFKVGD